MPILGILLDGEEMGKASKGKPKPMPTEDNPDDGGVD